MKRRVLALLLCLSLTGVAALAAETDTSGTISKPIISDLDSEPEEKSAVRDPDDPDNFIDTDRKPDAAPGNPDDEKPPVSDDDSDKKSTDDEKPIISDTDEDDERPFVESDPDDPDSAPLISAVDEPGTTVANPFEDVAENSPFLAGILYAVEQRITNGTTAKTFSPYAICTHAQIITFLWRGWGSPRSAIENPFSDNIKTSAYYYQAALWAYEKGMIDASFDPYAYCTRLQAVTYMWKLPGAPTVSQAAFPFTDVPDDADARNAVAWAVSHEITNGTSSTTFSPDKRCTRAQIVTFIYRARGLTAA